MRIQVVPVDAFATIASDTITHYFSAEQDVRICFTSGKTPTGTYAEMVRRHQAGEVNAGKVHAFTLDEYAGIAKTHPRSCFQSLSQHLYSGLEWPTHQLLTYDDSLSLSDAADAYERMVVEAGGFELSILGIGLNGHVGFNEPGTPFDSRTHVPKLAETTMQRAHAEGWDDAPTIGLTLGIGTLMESKHVMLMANGRHKADIIARIVNGDISEDIPATAFRDHPDSLLLLDEEAASRL